MPPKRKAAKISELALTDQEIEAAKTVLAAADKKKLASLKSSLTTFLAANPDDQINKDNKFDHKFLVKFIAHQSRCADTTKASSSQRTISESKINYCDVKRMSAEKMDITLGPKKAQHWRTMLKALPDSLSGSNDPDLQEYPVPNNWERMTTTDLKEFLMQFGGEPTSEEASKFLEMEGPSMDLMNAASESSGSGTQPTMIKSEPADQEQEQRKQLAMQIAKLKNDVPNLVREFQDMLLEANLINNKCKKELNPYHTLFASDLEGLCKKLMNTKSVLERLHRDEEANPSQIPKLLTAVEALRDKYKLVVEFAGCHGLIEAKGARKRKAKGDEK